MLPASRSINRRLLSSAGSLQSVSVSWCCLPSISHTTATTSRSSSILSAVSATASQAGRPTINSVTAITPLQLHTLAATLQLPTLRRKQDQLSTTNTRMKAFAFSQYRSSAAAASTLASNPINVDTTIFFCCDIQETFRGLIHQWDAVVNVSACMTRIANTLEIPLLVTEQQPFKPTISEIDVKTENVQVIAKHSFSMINEEVDQYLQQHSGRTHIVLFGIETHVCVLQTALDLLRRDYSVYVVTDAASSQRSDDREIALRRIERSGGKLTTSESITYEILGDAKHAKFKSILPIIKELSAFKKKEVAAT